MTEKSIIRAEAEALFAAFQATGAVPVDADILLTSQDIDYESYDLLHFINIIRPSDILFHINKTKKPFVLSPILVDYSEYDKKFYILEKGENSWKIVAKKLDLKEADLKKLNKGMDESSLRPGKRVRAVK